MVRLPRPSRRDLLVKQSSITSVQGMTANRALEISGALGPKLYAPARRIAGPGFLGAGFRGLVAPSPSWARLIFPYSQSQCSIT